MKAEDLNAWKMEAAGDESPEMKTAVFDPNPEYVTIACPRCHGTGVKQYRRLLQRLYKAPTVCLMCEGQKTITRTREEIGRMWPEVLKAKEEQHET